MKKNPPIKNEYTHGEPTPYRTNPFKKDVLYTEEGQWKYPGQVTKIPSGNITMRGVDYPVLGVDDLGNEQMMYPGANYTFPGQYVTEYPQMQKGGTPKDYAQFEEYNKTAPENRVPDKDWQYGNSKQYDHYGMWDALGKPKNFEEALKNNPDWQPDEYDHMYHGYSANPNTGVWLKPFTPGEHEPGSTAWMEYAATQLNPELAKNYRVIYDTDLKRMKGVPKEKYGGWLDNIDEEFRRGGPTNPLMLTRGKRKKTSKNIQSSINKIFLRNHDIFGPGGKNIYDPKSKYEYGGGWLDQMQEGASVIPKLRHKQDMADAYAAAADFKNSNRVSSTAVNKFIPSLTEEDIAAAEANKEFAKLPKAQQDAIIMQNQAMYSRGPEAQLSQGKKLTEEEQAYSDKVSRRIKYPFSDIGIAAGNVASYLGRFEGMSPEEIAASTNNPMGALGVSSDVASEAMINEMLGVGSSKLFKKGVQRAYGLHKYPNLPDLGLEPLPNGAHDPSTFKSMKDVGLEQQMAQARDAEAEAIHKKAFPLLEFQQPTIKPFGPSSARDKAMNNLKAIDDWHNWDTKYKGKNIAIDETGKKVGAFNEGVFEIKGHPEYVGKVEDINPSGKDARTVGEMYPHLDIEELHRGITSKNIGKVVKQIRHPDDITKRILISEKVHGTPWEKLTPRQFAKIPMEAHIQLDADMRHLRNNGLAVDWMGNNILYNPKEKAFKILDISPTKTTMGPTMTANWDQRIIKGVDQGLPNSQSAKLMRNAHLEKYNINQTLGLDGFQARAHGFDDVPFAKNTIDRMQLQSQMDSNPLSYWQNLYLQKAETISKRKHMELSRLLSKQPVDKMGGAWLDKLF